MAEQAKRSYTLSRNGSKVAYSVTEGDTTASIEFDLTAIFGIPAEGIAADALCSAIRAAARQAVAAKDPTDWQVALDEKLEQWTDGDWTVEGEGSVPFGVGAPLTKAVLSVYGEKFNGSAAAAAKAICEKLLSAIAEQGGDWDAMTDPEKNKVRRLFEKNVSDSDPNIALFLAELYAKQAADRAARKLAEQRAKLAAGGGSSLF